MPKNDYAIVISNKLSIVSEIEEAFPARFIHMYKNDVDWFIGHSLSKLGIPCVLLNNSLKDIKEQNIIVFDLHITKEFLTYLKEMYPKKRIIFWYWNAVDSIEFKPELIPDGIEKWSYVKSDCLKYNMMYNTSFFSSRINIPIQNGSSVFFLEKKREEKLYLMKLQRSLKKKKFQLTFTL